MSEPLMKLVSSQFKLLPSTPDAEIDARALTCATALTNEPFSFQVLYRAEPSVAFRQIGLRVEADDASLPLGVWRVDFVPVASARNDYHEKGYESDEPGLFPDLLMERPAAPELVRVDSRWYEKDTANLLNASGSGWQPVWVTVNPDSTDVKPGVYTLTVTMSSLTSGADLGSVVFTLEVIPAALPAFDYRYTNWFHCDALCDYYRVEPFTKEFYDLFRLYVKNMVRHRQNTLLVPAFTPALDTPVGGARRNVQLVDITKDADGWHFGFDRLWEYLRIADECGISFFEHCHLFSQWGAVHAPNIYDVNGAKLFGWDTDAAGDEYAGFIRAYLTAFLAFAKEKGIDRRMVFHISDEPTKQNLPTYSKAVAVVGHLLDDYMVADAMSDYELYEAGAVQTPIVGIAHADDFVGRCPRYWVYYTCGTYYKNCTNRLISNTAARERVLGVQMYRYNAIGFLHWGYNYYYDTLTSGWYDPKANPCGYKLYPGCSYLAYPLHDGAAPSVREKLMAEAFDDCRALKLLEGYIGREAVLALCEETLGGPVNTVTIPEKDALVVLRERVNALIREKVRA